jgi:hypothetical protein
MVRIAAAAGLFIALATVSHTSFAACDNANDCKGGRVCSNGSCVDAGCSKDTDCAGDDICNAGVCSGSTSEPVNPPAATASPAPEPTVPPAAAAVSPPAGPAPVPPPAAPAPVATTTETEGIKGLIIAGAVVWGAVWLLGIPITIGIDAGLDGDIDPVSGFMAIPLVGPWIALGEVAPKNQDAFNPPIILSGVLQSAGAIMLVLGLAIRSPVEVPVYGSGELAVAPMALGDNGAGIGLRLDAF